MGIRTASPDVTVGEQPHRRSGFLMPLLLLILPLMSKFAVKSFSGWLERPPNSLKNLQFNRVLLKKRSYAKKNNLDEQKHFLFLQVSRLLKFMKFQNQPDFFA
jgi:hypothetical protein